MKKIDEEKIKTLIDLLKFSLSLDDEEIKKTAIESVIESLEDLLI